MPDASWVRSTINFMKFLFDWEGYSIWYITYRVRHEPHSVRPFLCAQQVSCRLQCYGKTLLIGQCTIIKQLFFILNYGSEGNWRWENRSFFVRSNIVFGTHLVQFLCFNCLRLPQFRQLDIWLNWLEVKLL